jgi:Zn-dependent protease
MESEGVFMPAQSIGFIPLLLSVPAILAAATIHEFSRALVSMLLGDTTPAKEKRLTLNPVNHFEPIGFLLMFATGFGWGKPVNTNPRYYKNRRAGVILTAVLPSVFNLITATAALSLIGFAVPYTPLYDFIMMLVRYNIYFVVCNFFPCAPFDCYKLILEFTSRKGYFVLTQQESVMQLIFILLLLMNVLPRITLPLVQFFTTLVSALALPFLQFFSALVPALAFLP